MEVLDENRFAQINFRTLYYRPIGGLTNRTNGDATFDGAKALTKASDVAEFYKVASSNYAAAAEKFTAQGKELAELYAKVVKSLLYHINNN